jgi:hypothetical protein
VAPGPVLLAVIRVRHQQRENPVGG